MKLPVYWLFLIIGLLIQGHPHAQSLSLNDDKSKIVLKLDPSVSMQTIPDLIRHAETSDSLILLFADGVYSLDQPLILIPEDIQNRTVIFRAEHDGKAVFSGGKKLGKHFYRNGLVKMEFDTAYPTFDQLYVNGHRAVLARYPDQGFCNIIGVKETVVKRGKGRYAEKAIQEIFLDDSTFQFLRTLSDKALRKVRFKIFHKWDFTVRYIDSLNTVHKSLFTHGLGMKPWNPWKKGSRIIFENVETALTHPGEWYLDNQKVLSYFPKKGQNEDSLSLIIPQVGQWLILKGDPAGKHYVKNISFEGLVFQYAGFPMSSKGFEPNQAAVSEKAAICLIGAKNIVFKQCEIKHIGQHAIWFGEGCSACVVDQCYLQDLGGGGIYLGPVHDTTETQHVDHIKIMNTIIHSGGRIYPPSVGIWVGHSSDNEVVHNDIGDFYYTGISVGWVWGYAPSKAKRNKIAYNHIHHIGWDLLSDMAAVYTLGRSEGTCICHNVIHHVHAYSYGGWGLYTDEGSSGILMEDNLVYSTKTGGFHQHYGENNIIRNNIFAYAKLYQLQCTRVEDHLSFTFDHNIVVFNEGVLLQGPWFQMNISMDSNIYWNTRGKTYSFAGKPFNKWKKRTGHDRHSFILDPGFKDPEHFDFGWKDKGRVKKIGFEIFDFSKVGVFGPQEWLDKAKLSKTILEKFDEAVRTNTGY